MGRAAEDRGLRGDPPADDLRRPARELPERRDRLERDRGEASSVTDQLTTYTLGWTKEDLAHEIVPDDLAYARQVGTQFGVDYHERILDADIVELLPKLVWHLDEPVADPAVITSYLICSAARERLTVILSGMGGDEVFAGYPRHLAAKIGRMADVLPAARAASSAAPSRET